MLVANNETKIMKELRKLKVHNTCCLIYETEAEWEASVIPFIKQGLINGDKCIYLTQRRDEAYIMKCFTNQGIDVNGYINSGQLLLIPGIENYSELNLKKIDQIIESYTNRLNQYLSEGYSNIRLSSESITKLLTSADSRNCFLEIQLRVNRDIYPYYPIKTLLQYHRHEDHPIILRDAVISNHCIFKSGIIYRNPATIPPEMYFQHKDAAWEAEYWLRTQEAILDSEKKYRLIFEHSLDMITLIDIDSFEILFASPAHLRMLGYSPEEVIGRNCLEFIRPDQRETMLEEFQEQFTGSSGEGIFAIKKKDGSYLWTEGRGNVIRMIDAKDQFILFTRDVHDKKLAEDALYRSEQKFRYQLSYLNTLINNMNELCLTYDRNGCLTFVNQRLIDKLGYRAEEVLGKSLLGFFVDEHKEAVKEELEQRLQGEFGSHEHRLLCKDGSELLVELKGSPIMEDDEITGGLVLADDITRQRQMERDMERLGQLHMVGEMAASIAHEIRNPMTTVQGFLQMISQKEEFRDHQEYFDLMLEELKRADLIISEFLSLAKDKVANLRCQNLNAIIQALAPLLMADALNGDKNIKFELSKLPDLLLDENEIRQLILNLVRNGLEAMEEGGSVTVKSWKEDDKVVFAVQDEGSGIPEEIIDKLGTPFLSTKQNGTGLGLAVCYSIATRHQAFILPETSQCGSTVKVVFNCA